MSAETTLYNSLTAHAGLKSLVATRIHADKRDEDEDLPSVVYQRVKTQHVNTIHNTIAATTITLGISCVAEARTEAEAVATQLLAALSDVFVVLDRSSDYDPDTQNYFTTLTVNYHE